MEQVNAKRVAIFVVSVCLIGMVVGSAVTLAVLNVQRAILSSGMVVAVNVGVYSDSACTYFNSIIFCMFISKAAVGFSSFHASSTCGWISPSTPTFAPLTTAAPTRPSTKLE